MKLNKNLYLKILLKHFYHMVNRTNQKIQFRNERMLLDSMISRSRKYPNYKWNKIFLDHISFLFCSKYFTTNCIYQYCIFLITFCIFSSKISIVTTNYQNKFCKYIFITLSLTKYNNVLTITKILFCDSFYQKKGF